MAEIGAATPPCNTEHARQENTRERAPAPSLPPSAVSLRGKTGTAPARGRAHAVVDDVVQIDRPLGHGPELSVPAVARPTDRAASKATRAVSTR